jgi:RNA polymerase sigma-70 factor (ECF subfamily)
MSTSDRVSQDQRWAQQICEGDYDAFESLFRAYASDLCDFVHSFVDSRDVAESLVQEVFFTIWEGRDDWTPPDNVKSYLYTAARNKALDHLDHNEVVDDWRETASSQESARRTPLEELHYEELRAEVEAAIERLPERRRQVFTLSRQHGLTYPEIADVLDITVSTVETQMTRALKALREELSAYL